MSIGRVGNGDPRVIADGASAVRGGAVVPQRLAGYGLEGKEAEEKVVRDIHDSLAVRLLV